MDCDSNCFFSVQTCIREGVFSMVTLMWPMSLLVWPSSVSELVLWLVSM